MLGSFNAQKSIAIYEEKRFCRSSQFPTDFPPELAGAMDPYEYRQSIKNINRARRKPIGQKIINLIFLLCLVIGLAVTIVGLVLINNTSSAVWIALTVVGIGVSVITLILSGCLLMNPFSSPAERVSNAVYAESSRYMTRRPISTRWQLSLDPGAIGTSQFGLLGSNYALSYILIIDIGKADRAFRHDGFNLKLNLSEPASYTDQQKSVLPPSFQNFALA